MALKALAEKCMDMGLKINLLEPKAVSFKTSRTPPPLRMNGEDIEWRSTQQVDHPHPAYKEDPPWAPPPPMIKITQLTGKKDNLDRNDLARQAHQLLVGGESEGTEVYYTDGSVDPNTGRAAATFFHKDVTPHHRLLDGTSTLQTELAAILKSFSAPTWYCYVYTLAQRTIRARASQSPSADAQAMKSASDPLMLNHPPLADTTLLTVSANQRAARAILSSPAQQSSRNHRRRCFFSAGVNNQEYHQCAFAAVFPSTSPPPALPGLGAMGWVKIKHPKPKKLATKRQLHDILSPAVKATRLIHSWDAVIDLTATHKDDDKIFEETTLKKLV
ncbi:hypothetical protein O3P69_007201 [Scylla paramamosain]|uniref:Uncharacterized protein n=1 Tax=Scylla paramamosain TaxID=85552 RepID=A0AAW0V2C5_SCYPA